MAASGVRHLPATVDAVVISSHAVASATAGVWRVYANDWSVVLKVLRHGTGGHANWQAGDDVEHWYYWRREALAYGSGVLDGLDGSLRAPRCFGVFDRDDGSVGLWLEDLGHGEAAGDWSLQRYREASYALGVAQGHSASRPEELGHPWLAREWLRRYVQRRSSLATIPDAQAWEHDFAPLSSDTRHRVAGVWQRRERLLALTEAAPACLSHNDVHPDNLFALGSQTVLIDWAFIGAGHLGQDASTLIVDAVLDFFVPPAEFPALEDAITSGYVAGVATSAPHIDPNVIRRAIWATAAVKYFWIPGAMIDAAVEGRDTLNGRPIDQAFRWWAQAVPHLFGFADRLSE